MAAIGLDESLRRKRAAAYDQDLENSCRTWIEAVTGESIGDDFAEGLKDGQILCKVVNAIEPGKIKKVAASSMAFRQMENIAKFLEAAADLGVAGPSLFQTVALYEQKDMLAVLICIQALSRAATEGGYTGPAIDINRPEAI